MNAVTQITPLDSQSDTNPLTQRRAAIDLIATTRAKMVRAALFANYLFRLHPSQPESRATRQSWCAELQVQLDDLEQVCELMEGRSSTSSIGIDIAKWIGKHAAIDKRTIKTLETMRTLTQAMVDAAIAEDSDALERAIKAQNDFGRAQFFESITTFIDILWADLEATRTKEVERANATASAISNTLQRLEHIGKHVRLVSLNASVEAARVGDAGRGLGVIAVEFKTLAEEIQRLAVTARADITSMERQ